MLVSMCQAENSVQELDVVIIHSHFSYLFITLTLKKHVGIVRFEGVVIV